jgi:hypothetical protein
LHYGSAIRYNDSGFFDLIAKAIIWTVVMTTLFRAAFALLRYLPRDLTHLPS